MLYGVGYVHKLALKFEKVAQSGLEFQNVAQIPTEWLENSKSGTIVTGSYIKFVRCGRIGGRRIVFCLKWSAIPVFFEN